MNSSEKEYLRKLYNFLVISKEEQPIFNDFIKKMFAVPEFYKKNCQPKFKTKKPSELKGEEWLEIWNFWQKSDKIE